MHRQTALWGHPPQNSCFKSNFSQLCPDFIRMHEQLTIGMGAGHITGAAMIQQVAKAPEASRGRLIHTSSPVQAAGSSHRI